MCFLFCPLYCIWSQEAAALILPPLLFVFLTNCLFHAHSRTLWLSHRCRKSKQSVAAGKKRRNPNTDHPPPPPAPSSDTTATHAHLNTADNSRNLLPQKPNSYNTSCAAVMLLSCWTVWGGGMCSWTVRYSTITNTFLYFLIPSYRVSY